MTEHLQHPRLLCIRLSWAPECVGRGRLSPSPSPSPSSLGLSFHLLLPESSPSSAEKIINLSSLGPLGTIIWTLSGTSHSHFLSTSPWYPSHVPGGCLCHSHFVCREDGGLAQEQCVTVGSGGSWYVSPLLGGSVHVQSLTLSSVSMISCHPGSPYLICSPQN